MSVLTRAKAAPTAGWKYAGLAAAALLAAAIQAAPTSAQAAVVITRFLGAPDPGPRPGETKLIDFNSGALPSGVTLTGDWGIVTGSHPNLFGAPAGDATKYLSVPRNRAPGSAVMMFNHFLSNEDVSHFSFYWGSIDTYNTIQLLNRSGGVLATIAGSALPPAKGSLTIPSENERIEFALSGADQQLGGLKFTSGKFAFESDTFAFDAISAVPEPATWAMMLIAFFGLGALARRRRGAVAAAA